MATKPKARPSPKAVKAKPEKKEKSQRERFIEAAREVGVDETGKEFERLFERVMPSKRKSAND